MDFQWDNGNLSHIALHEITAEEAEQVVENDPVDLGGTLRNGEPRTAHLGQTDAGRVLFVVLTERNGLYRVVTARPSRRAERAFYLNYKASTDDLQDP